MTKTTTVKNIKYIDATFINDIRKTYRGDLGCACGCGGNYYDADDVSNAQEVSRRIKYVLRGIAQGKAEFFDNGVEVANPSYTRVTRLYFKDGIYYNTNRAGQIVREVKVGA